MAIKKNSTRKSPKKKPCKINGRRVESNIVKGLSKVKHPLYIFRFNENRRNPTPADIYLSTPKYNVLVEVKATMRGKIQKGNIRKKQIERMTAFQDINDSNISLVCLYFSGKIALVNVESIKELKSSITFVQAKEAGLEVIDWNQINRYLARLKIKNSA